MSQGDSFPNEPGGFIQIGYWDVPLPWQIRDQMHNEIAAELAQLRAERDAAKQHVELMRDVLHQARPALLPEIAQRLRALLARNPKFLAIAIDREDVEALLEALGPP